MEASKFWWSLSTLKKATQFLFGWACYCELVWQIFFSLIWSFTQVCFCSGTKPKTTLWAKNVFLCLHGIQTNYLCSYINNWKIAIRYLENLHYQKKWITQWFEHWCLSSEVRTSACDSVAQRVPDPCKGLRKASQRKREDQHILMIKLVLWWKWSLTPHSQTGHL